MNYIAELFGNSILLCGCIGWASAQVLKTIVHFAVNKTFDITRLIGDGGMPGGHTATVVAMATKTCMLYGFGSFEFAIAAMLAIIVMHDATGVRLETGKQAKVIKELVSIFESMGNDISGDEKLKEFVGHTYIQVFAGAILGIIIAFVWPF